MAQFDHLIIDEVAALKLPRPEEIVINHGGALVVRGLRLEHIWGDIDFATSLENIQYLREELGWRATAQVVGIKPDGTERTITATHDSRRRFDAHRWTFSVPRYQRSGKGRIYLPEQIERSDQDDVTGICVASLELVRETKLETGRSKDEEDVALIEAHLER